MNLITFLKDKIEKDKKILIFIQLLIFIISLGVLGKIYFYYKNIFPYFFLFFIFLWLYVLFNLVKKKEFKKIYDEAIKDYEIFIEEIEKKDDKYHINLIIKIFSFILLLFLFLYWNYTK